MRCKKNMVITTSSNRFPLCYDCEKKDMEGEIKDPEMQKMFDIPEGFYKQNSFLRSIKINYLRYENLTEKQIEAFKKTVDKMKNPEVKEGEEENKETTENK